MMLRLRPPAACALAVCLGLVVVGCGSSGSPTQGTLPGASQGPGSGAGAAYASAAAAAKVANATLAAQYTGTLTLAQAHDYYRQAAAIDGTFLQAMTAITFPANASADAATLVNRVTADQALDQRGSIAVTLVVLAAVHDARPADLAAVAAAGNALRADLGLPALP